MPIVPARCTQCGAELKVDSNKEAAVCEYCGSAFIVEKAINNYNTTINNSYNFAGANVTIQQGNVDSWIKIAESAVLDKNYEEANRFYLKVLEIDACYPRALFGRYLYTISSKNVKELDVDRICKGLEECLNSVPDTEFRIFALNAILTVFLDFSLDCTEVMFSQSKWISGIDVWNILYNMNQMNKIPLMCAKFLEENHFESDMEYIEIYKKALHFVIVTCKEICQTREAKDSSSFRVPDNLRAEVLKTYDNAVSRMNNVDPQYILENREIPKVNRLMISEFRAQENNISGQNINTSTSNN